MPAIPFKKILSFSSEDEVHKAINLLSQAAGLHWISSSQYNSKCLTVEIEMAKSSRIGQIEIGNLGSAFVEVLVSERENDGEGGACQYVSLLPQSMLMTAEESKTGRNLTRTKLFGQDRLSRSAMDKKWRYIKIQCLQPYLPQKPYGLRFIKLFQNQTSVPETGSLSLSTTLSPRDNLLRFSTPQHNMKMHSTPPSGRLKRTSASAPQRTPKLSSLSVQKRGGESPSNSATPKRPRQDRGSEYSEEFEFAGLENQSRLLRNTLKGNNKELADSNSILSRIAADAEKEKREEKEVEPYPRRRLLTRELNKRTDNSGIDYLSSYNEKTASLERSKTNRIYSFMKLSKLDDNSEIGEEPTFHRRRGGRRGRGTDSGWCKRRGGTRLGNPFLPIEMSDIPLLLETKQTSLVDLFNNVTPREDSDSNDTVGDYEEEATHSTGLKSEEDQKSKSDDVSSLQSCPICDKPVPLYALELHANDCAAQAFDTPTTNEVNNGSRSGYSAMNNITSSSGITPLQYKSFTSKSKEIIYIN